MTEFDIYKRIIDGDLRPHLKHNSSSETIEKEFYSLKFTNTGNPDDFLKNIEKLTTEFHGFQNGDEVKIELAEAGEPLKITIEKVHNESEEELINLDIPPAPDSKAEIYLRLIEDEYTRIRTSLIKNLEGLTTSGEITTYAKKNILIAKELSRKAHLLEKKLKVEGIDNWDNPNTYVMYIIKRYLIYSILKIQELFSEIAEFQPQNLEQLEDELFDYQHSKSMARMMMMDEKLNSRHLEKIYSEIDHKDEAKRDLLIHKLDELENKIKKERELSHGIPKYLYDREKLYLKELGNTLERLLFEQFEIASQNGLIARYDLLINTLAQLKYDSSIESKALNKIGFFERLELQINSTKELIEISKVQLVKEEILPDLIALCLTIQTRKRLNLFEDEWNNYLTDLLRAKQYGISDQTQSGQSGSRNRHARSGELDITVRNLHKNGTIKTIIECFELKSCGVKNKTVPEHINKLINRYDTAGNNECFIIIYSKAADFSQLWSNYQNRVNTLEQILNIDEIDSQKSDLKVGISQYEREGKKLKLYHLFLNMAINKPNKAT